MWQRIRREAHHAVGARTALSRLMMVMVVVMVVVRMHMMVVMMPCLVALEVARIGSAPTITICPLDFISRPSPILLPAFPKRLRSASTAVIIAAKITAVGLSSGRTHARRSRKAIGGMTTDRRGTAHTGAETGKHAAKFRLDARIVTARTNKARLCTLHSLR